MARARRKPGCTLTAGLGIAIHSWDMELVLPHVRRPWTWVDDCGLFLIRHGSGTDICLV